MKLFFASHNLDKKREIDYILKSHFINNVEVLYIDDFSNYPEIEETGKTLEENALIKCMNGYKFTLLPSFADDTGLEIEAINGNPGIFTARYAGENAAYRDNYEKVLFELKDCNKRKAVFKTVIALIINENKHVVFEGECSGVISKEPKGENGFGYDPIFIPDGYKLTFAQMDEKTKNGISHRAKALKKFTDYLKNFSGA